jgi:hypothetical protein
LACAGAAVDSNPNKRGEQRNKARYANVNPNDTSGSSRVLLLQIIMMNEELITD